MDELIKKLTGVSVIVISGPRGCARRTSHPYGPQFFGFRIHFQSPAREVDDPLMDQHPLTGNPGSSTDSGTVGLKIYKGIGVNT